MLLYTHTQTHTQNRIIVFPMYLTFWLPGWLSGKESACQAGAAGDVGRCPGGRNSYLFPYSCLRNPMDRGIVGATVHRVTKSQTRWSTQTCRQQNLSPNGCVGKQGGETLRVTNHSQSSKFRSGKEVVRSHLSL